jgi:peptide/nickel transport system substrate-binding protein
MFLNVRTPPFDDVRVRQALNYAVDRRAVVDFFGGPDLADPTCQILPPGFPNYAPTCRYTLDPGPGGAWTAPDLARARRLIGQSGTTGMAVTVWTSSPERGIGRYFASLLSRLGYRATLRIAPGDSYFDRILDPRTRAQIGISGWGADHAAPSNFATLFTCADGFNLSGFCDRGLERRIDAALAAHGPEAGTRWKDAYAYIADAAPAVPLANGRAVVLLSERAGNYQHRPLWVALLDQLWVR